MTCLAHPDEPRTEPNKNGLTFCRGCLRASIAAKPEAFLLDAQETPSDFSSWLGEGFRKDRDIGAPKERQRKTGSRENVIVRRRLR